MNKTRLYCYLSLLLITGITAFFAYRASKLEFDYNFENYFPVNDSDPGFFFEFRKKFGSDNDYLFIAIENNNGIFHQDFLKKIKNLSDSLSILPFVESVQSPVNFSSPVISEMGFFEIPYIHLDDPSKYADDSSRIFKTEWLVNSFFSADAMAVNIVVKNKISLAKKKSDTLLLSIENLLNRNNFDAYHIAGRIHAQHYFLLKMRREIILFFIVSLFLVIVTLFITYRTGWGVVFPVMVVFISILSLFGIINILGKSLDIMSSLLPTIIFVVGMSDVIHIISKYLEEIRNGKNKSDALKTSFKEIGLATFLTSFTTAIGFLSLLTSGIIPIRQFGLFSALGVCLAFVSAYLVLPPLLLLLKKPEVKTYPEFSWEKSLHRAFLFIIRKRKGILIITVVISFFSLLGLIFLKVDNFLLEDLSDKDDFKKEYLYFENKFSGVRPFEMELWVKDTSSSFLKMEGLRNLEKIENYLKKDYGAGFLYSPVTIVKLANQSLHNGSLNEYRLPSTEAELNETKKILSRVTARDEIKMVTTANFKNCRISGKMPDYGGRSIKNKNNALDSFMVKNVDTNKVGYKITGTAALIDKNNELLVKNMLYGLLFASIIIAITFGLVFGSLKIICLALIPNILPLIMIGGIMGFSGIDLKISTSMVFTIAFGIVVDDTIHFLSRMRLEMRKGKSWLYAMKRTYISTGKALALTTIVLMSGFLSLVLSAFASSYYIGLLISLTLLFGLAGDMILLPVLLIIFYKKNKHNEPSFS